MPTFKSVLETASGLYCDQSSGRSYLGRELLERLPNEVLTSSASLERVGSGVYAIHLKTNGSRTFELYSRRRCPRLENLPSADGMPSPL
jgi:hypothetical protein